jgi:myo-inositol-1(or 4)-monophosphatase
MATDLIGYLEFATRLAKDAGDIARKYFSHETDFIVKDDNSPVTMADTEINRLVISRCREAYPDIDVLGEEESDIKGEGKLLWVCDPIDGTIPYSLGMPISSVCLALVDDGAPVLGIIYDFHNDRLFSAVKGQGAWLNGDPIQAVNDVKPMKMVSIEWWHSAAYNLSAVRNTLAAKGYRTPNYCSGAVTCLTIASRRMSGLVYASDKPWDAAPNKVILEELGCRVTDLSGNEQRYDRPIRGYIACVPEVFDELVSACDDALLP